MIVHALDLQLFAEGETAAPEGSPEAAATPEAPPAETTPAAAEPAAPAAPPAPTTPPEPVTYSFQLPEGVAIDPEINTELQAALNGLKATPDQAQALVNLQLKTIAKQQALVDQYLAKEKADTEAYLGTGAERSKKEENIGRGKQILDPTGELMQLFDAAHLGNSKLLAQAFERIGASAKEGQHVPGKGPATERNWADVMYTLPDQK